MFEIEANVPTPERRVAGAPAIYPFAKLRVGESFFVPFHIQRAKIVRNAATWHAKRYGKLFTVKIVEGGARCWRVS